MTSVAFRRKQLVEVVLAVWFAILLVEIIGTQLFATSGALKALRMPGLSHRIDEVVLGDFNE